VARLGSVVAEISRLGRTLRAWRDQLLAYQQQLQKFTCALRKLAWPPRYAIQSLEQQRLTLPDLLEVDLGISGAGRGGREGSICPRQTRPVRFGYDREQRQHEHR
jgi:hypothetical protein